MTGVSVLRRELKAIDSKKPQLVRTARSLGSVERVELADSEYREVQAADGGVVKSLQGADEFEAVWEDILEVMSVIAPVTETTASGDGAMLSAVADGTRATLEVTYYADGSLKVRALWSASTTSAYAMVVVDEKFIV